MNRRLVLAVLVLVAAPAAGCLDGTAPDPSQDGADDGRSQEVQALEDRIDTLEAELDDRNATVAALEADLDAAEDRIQDLEAQLEEARQGNDTDTSTDDGTQDGGSANFTQTTLDEAQAVADQARDSVVYLEIDDGVESGTGWFVEDGYILTNQHVVAQATTIRAFLVDGTEIDVTVEETLARPDLALLSTPHDGPVLPTAETVDLEVDQPLVQVGHPGGVGAWVQTLGRYLRTYVSPADDDRGDYDDLSTTVPGRSGVSGSPILDLDGQVVGITYGATPVYQPPPPGEAPEPHDPAIITGHLHAPAHADHVAIDDAMKRVDAWT